MTRTSFVTGLRCVHCNARFPVAAMFEGCPTCATDEFRSGLTPEYDYAAVADTPFAEPDRPGIWRYRRLLPVRNPDHELSLGEGGTALVPLPRVARELGAESVWLKDESRNPTWSFKDRNAAVTLGMALEFGAHAVVASSSGNHGVAVAAYAARAGLRCLILTYPGLADSVRGAIQAYGAELAITSREGRWAILRRAVAEHGWFPATNYTTIPTNGAYGHEGYKTIAYELYEQLGGGSAGGPAAGGAGSRAGRMPDIVAVPTSYGEGLFGIWKGFHELRRLGLLERAPRMVACEPEGGPLGAAVSRGDGRTIASVPARLTSARGIGGTTNSYISVAALSASDGGVGQASDEDILRAQLDLASEGILAEPASAASLAGLRAIARRGELPAGQRIVLISTSGGLKNIDPLLASLPVPVALDDDPADARRVLQGDLAARRRT